MNTVNKDADRFMIDVKSKINVGFKKMVFLMHPANFTNLTTEENEARIELLELIQKTKSEWKNSISNFEQATERDIIDYHAYMIKAHQLRYNYLIKKAKELGIKDALK